ncbi:MAG: sigma 54-interacting transcriptional regulator [Kiritimatiellia bacterium]
MSSILVVGDESGTVAILDRLLKTEGYKVRVVGDGAEAKKAVDNDSFDLFVEAMTYDRDPNCEIAAYAKSVRADMPVIFIGDEKGKTEERANEMGCIYIRRPLKIDQLLKSVQKMVDYADSEIIEDVNLNLQLQSASEYDDLVAESASMKSICKMISRVAPTDISVLITGDKGTEKDTIASFVHGRSRQKKHDMVTVDCSGESSRVGKELFGNDGNKGCVAAAGGTLYLKNVDQLGSDHQYKLLGALEKSDIRVIADTAVKLGELVESGRFDEALYKFLKVVPVKVPPLRERKNDILPNVREILRNKLPEGAALPSLEPQLAEELKGYEWPGNIAELESVLDKMLKAAGKNRKRLTADLLQDALH